MIKWIESGSWRGTFWLTLTSTRPKQVVHLKRTWLPWCVPPVLFTNNKSKRLMLKRPVTQFLSELLMCNRAWGCQSSVQTLPQFKKKVTLRVEGAKGGWGLPTLPPTPLLRAVCWYIQDQVQLCRTLLLRFIWPCRVIHIPLDRMDTPVPCRPCKNLLPMEVRSASTDTLTCLGLTPSY